MTLWVLDFSFLIVGSVLAIPPVRSNLLGPVIRCTGTIGFPDELPQQANNQTNLDQIGYLTILGSIGFFTVAYLHKRKLTAKD